MKLKVRREMSRGFQSSTDHAEKKASAVTVLGQRATALCPVEDLALASTSLHKQHFIDVRD